MSLIIKFFSIIEVDLGNAKLAFIFLVDIMTFNYSFKANESYKLPFHCLKFKTHLLIKVNFQNYYIWSLIIYWHKSSWRSLCPHGNKIFIIIWMNLYYFEKSLPSRNIICLSMRLWEMKFNNWDTQWILFLYLTCYIINGSVGD